MKLAIAMLAVMATATMAYEIPNLGRGELYKDLQDFIDLLPTEKMMAIAVEYLSEDAEFQAALAYFQSPEFQKLLSDVEALPEVVHLMNYIQGAGVDVYYMANRLNEFVGIAKLVPPPELSAYSSYKITGGLAGFFADIKAILPSKAIQDMYDHKLKTSPAFADLIAHLSSAEFQHIVDKLFANDQFMVFFNKAKEMGVDVGAVIYVVEHYFGIKVPKTSFYYIHY